MNANRQDRIVVVGSGRLGLRTARLLDDRGHSVVIVERNPDRVRDAADAYVATIIEGDATRPSILEQAGIQEADVVAALTDTMGTNIAVCQITKRIAPSTRTVMRTVHSDEEGYDGYADEIIFPEAAGARVAVNAIAGGVRSVEGLAGELDLLEIEVRSAAPVAGRTLEEVALPEGSLVISSASGHRVATASTELKPGQTFLVAAEPRVADEVLQLFHG